MTPAPGRGWLAAALLVGAVPASAAETLGRSVYERNCVACHGADGAGGMPGVADLTVSAGPMIRPDAELLVSLRDGIARPGNPVVMPPRGGNPALTDDDLRAVLRYLRELTGIATK